MSSKEIKIEAKSKIAERFWTLVLINLLYSIIIVIINSITESLDFPLIKLVISIAALVVLPPFSYGVLVSTLKIVRNEDVTCTEFLNIGLQNISKVWSMILSMVKKLFLPFILTVVSAVLIGFSTFATAGGDTSNLLFFVIATILYIASLVYLVIKGFGYSLVLYLLNDKPDTSNDELLEESNTLMTGNKGNFFMLLLSFIGWYFLVGLVSAIISDFFPATLASAPEFLLSAILAPYIAASQVVFYERLKDGTHSGSNVVIKEISKEDTTIEEK